MPIPVALIVGLGLPTLTGLGYALTKKAERDAAAREAARKAGIFEECEAQRVALEQAAAAGHSAAELQVIRINLAACVRKAGQNGVTVDTNALALLPCQQQRQYLERVFTDYRGTGYVDPVARDNKRNNILSAGSEMVSCLRAQLLTATTRAQVQVILDEINGAAVESRARAVCFFEGSDGCGRFALNEEEGNVRGMKELAAIGVPLGAPWVSGYAALGFGERFREASGLQDRSRELADGDYGGLRREAEAKFAALPAPRLVLNPGIATTLVPGRMLGLGPGITLRGF